MLEVEDDLPKTRDDLRPQELPAYEAMLAWKRARAKELGYNDPSATSFVLHPMHQHRGRLATKLLGCRRFSLHCPRQPLAAQQSAFHAKLPVNGQFILRRIGTKSSAALRIHHSPAARGGCPVGAPASEDRATIAQRSPLGTAGPGCDSLR